MNSIGLITVATGFLIVALIVSGIRLIKGPTVLDRVIALDSLTITVLGFILIISRNMTSLYKDSILLITLLGFLGALSFSLYLSQQES